MWRLAMISPVKAAALVVSSTLIDFGGDARKRIEVASESKT
jgi:hypothetical protein